MSQNWYLKRALEYFVSNLRVWYPSHHVIHCNYQTLLKAHQSHNTWSQRAHKQVATCSSRFLSHWPLPIFLAVATTQFFYFSFVSFKICSWNWRRQKKEKSFLLYFYHHLCHIWMITCWCYWSPVSAPTSACDVLISDKSEVHHVGSTPHLGRQAVSTSLLR